MRAAPATAFPLPAIPHLRLLKRMRESEKDREDLRYLDLLEEAGPGGA